MSRALSGRTYWIIGASEGLGRALSLALAGAGARLVLSARNGERLASLAAEAGAAEVLPLDVTRPDLPPEARSIASQVDGIVYCVGLYEPMAARDWKSDVALAMCEANFLGAMRILGACLPPMIARDRGHVVLIGSLAGYRGLPRAIGYGASKAALMHLAENLQTETAGTGVRVQLVNPGFIRTRLTAKNSFAMPAIMTPEAAAACVLSHMRSRRFRRDFPRPFAFLFNPGRMLPDRLFARLFRNRG
jgi:short-subunit dehydrogenase